jgi:hypothetical protein
MRQWRLAGIPLRVVLRGIRDALDAHEVSFDRHRSVGSLRYCAGEVQAAYARWRTAVGRHGAGAVAPSEAVERLARELDARGTVPEAAKGEVKAVVEGLYARSRSGEAPERVEAWLSRREAVLRRRLLKALGDESANDLEQEIERDLAPYRKRMPDRLVKQIHDDGLTRSVFDRFDLPRLTLFPAS